MPFTAESVSFAYRDAPVVNSVSFALEPGRFYGIVGPNGCGKTTLVDLLLGHRVPSEGAVRYSGKPVSRYAKKDLARLLALVPQNFYINFPFTAKEVVTMGRYPHLPRFGAASAEDAARVQEIMRQTDTLAFKNRPVTELSGGERQRVVFARALAQDTPVLILDEATSNLDINHTLSLLSIAAERVLSRRHSVIAVMQDINLAALFCDSLIFMKQGRIAAHGPTREVLSRETLRSVFDVDAKIYFDDYSRSQQVVYRRTGDDRHE
ncbi:ABC transporter ATP-binding protein [Thermodesulfobacteriota bacterium]